MTTQKCPLIGKKCVEHQCTFWVHLVGLHPQTGQPTDQWNCSIAWLPILLIENANESRKAAASTDKVANEVRALKDKPIVIDLGGLINGARLDQQLPPPDKNGHGA